VRHRAWDECRTARFRCTYGACLIITRAIREQRLSADWLPQIVRRNLGSHQHHLVRVPSRHEPMQRGELTAHAGRKRLNLVRTVSPAPFMRPVEPSHQGVIRVVLSVPRGACVNMHEDPVSIPPPVENPARRAPGTPRISCMTKDDAARVVRGVVRHQITLEEVIPTTAQFANLAAAEQGAGLVLKR
jgi:hypothetical protein